MKQIHTIRTQRLILGPWKEEYLQPFIEMNVDPKVMEYFPALKTVEESTQEYNRIVKSLEEQGWGLWAASLADSGKFMGFVGLKNTTFQAHFTPAVEIGWRLAVEYWGKGYATEGARASLKYGFESLGVEEIVAFTSVDNKKSSRVMEKIGMTYDPKGDFNHPNIPESFPLRRLQVLYRIRKTPLVVV